jgi:hypothetical protein
MKYIIIVAIILAFIGGGAIVYFIQDPALVVTNTIQKGQPLALPTTASSTTPEPAATSTTRGPKSTIGESVQGNPITAYHFGTGTDEIIFIGGIHGGYAWNTSLLAYELIDYLTANPTLIPTNLTITVIPILNPDGLALVTGSTSRFTARDVAEISETKKVAGRFNANMVDLNRNFDCKWQATSKWQTQTVSGGGREFSEPESQAIRDYVTEVTPAAIITWYSAAGGVYASRCTNQVSEETAAITQLFAQAADYSAHETFDDYEISGDMVNWFAAQNIPAISVILTTHEGTDWSQNKAGVEALLTFYTK